MSTIEEAARRLAQLTGARVQTPSAPAAEPEPAAPIQYSYAGPTPSSSVPIEQSPLAAARAQQRIQRTSSERWQMPSSLLISLLFHALLLSLTFGDQAFGLPGLGFPWQERRAQVPDFRLVIVPARITNTVPASDSVTGPEQQASIDRPVARETAPTPSASSVPPGALEMVATAKPNANAKPEQAVAPATPAKASTRPDKSRARLPAKRSRTAAIDVAPSDSPKQVGPIPPTGPDVMTAAPDVSSPETVMPAHPDPGAQARERIDQEVLERAAAFAKQADQLDAARVEAARVAAEKREVELREEAARVNAARMEAQREEAAQLAAARLEFERQQVARQEAAARIEAERQAAAQLEAERVLAARQEAARVETARAAQLEAERQQVARQEAAARIEAERQAAAQLEAQRALTARQEAARIEAARAAQLEAERQEAARQEALARLEAARRAEAQLEAERRLAARQETPRVEAAPSTPPTRVEAAPTTPPARVETAPATPPQAQVQQPMRQDGPRAEPARPEAARQEPARQEPARQEPARQEPSRQEAAPPGPTPQEVARGEAEKEEARREERRRAIGRQLNEEAAKRQAAEDGRQLPLSLSTARRVRLWGRSDPNVELVQYAEAWARKIQFNTPVATVQELAKQPHRHPTVTVAVRSDGSVESVTFVISSGVAEVDDAIRRIVKSHEHYQAFPPALAREYDVIEIRRTWHFNHAVWMY